MVLHEACIALGTVLSEMVGWGVYLQTGMLGYSPIIILKLIFDILIRTACFSIEAFWKIFGVSKGALT